MDSLHIIKQQPVATLGLLCFHQMPAALIPTAVISMLHVSWCSWPAVVEGVVIAPEATLLA
jgi:hypothetical protein